MRFIGFGLRLIINQPSPYGDHRFIKRTRFFFFFGVSWLNILSKGCKACGMGTQERYFLMHAHISPAECYFRVFLSFNLQYLRYEW